MNLHRLLFPWKSERLDDLLDAHARTQLDNYALREEIRVLRAELLGLNKELSDTLAQLDAETKES